MFLDHSVKDSQILLTGLNLEILVVSIRIDIVENLYASAEVAIEAGNYIDASLLQAQADLLFQPQENLGTAVQAKVFDVFKL